MVPVQHRPAGKHDGRDVDGGGAHQAGGRGLVAAGGEHDAVQRVAVQHLHERQVGEVAVQRRRRPLARFLDRVDREFQRQAAGGGDAVPHPLRQVEVVAVAGGDVAAGLGDADDRLARLQLAPRQAEIEVALGVERGHARIVRVVEPALAAELEGLLGLIAAGHVGVPRSGAEAARAGPVLSTPVAAAVERTGAEALGLGTMATPERPPCASSSRCCSPPQPC